MKTTGKAVEENIARPYTIHLQASPEGGYVASVVELPGCISQGGTRSEAMEMIQDAMREWIAAAWENGEEIPEPNDVL